MASPTLNSFPSGRNALAAFVADLGADVAKRLTAEGRNATGRTARSIGSEVTEGVAITGTLYAASNWRFVGNGRGPGKPTPLAPLITWALAKGVASNEIEARSIAVRISRRHAREGSADHRAGNANVFILAIEAAQPQLANVVRAFLQDMDEPIARQFTGAVSNRAAA